MYIAIIILAVATFIGLIILGNYKYEKARAEKMEVVANDLGLQFFPQGDPAVHDTIGDLQLFNRGHSKKFQNMLSGKTDEIDIAIFGYRYTTGHGKNQQTHKQSVISFVSSELDLPAFEVRPEHFFHKIGQAFGYKDIDFDSHPEFSKRYLLRGPVESDIREFFTPEILQFFESQKGISVEAAGSRLIYYQARRRINPDEMRSFMEEGFRVFRTETGVERTFVARQRIASEVTD